MAGSLSPRRQRPRGEQGASRMLKSKREFEEWKSPWEKKEKMIFAAGEIRRQKILNFSTRS